MKEIIEDWKKEAEKKHGQSGYTIVTMQSDYPDNHLTITTSAYAYWMGAQGKSFNKYASKLKEKGYTVEVRPLPFNSVIYSLNVNLF